MPTHYIDEEKFDWFDVILFLMFMFCSVVIVITDALKGVKRAIHRAISTERA